MKRIVAMQWDGEAAQFLVSRPQPTGLAWQDGFAVPLASGTGPTDWQRAADVLAAVLRQRQLQRADVIVCLSRQDVELQTFTAPDCPAPELPDLVRFQSLQQFTTIREDWPVDYCAVASAGTGGQRVLAATISPQIIQQFEEACRRNRAQLSRVVLRPAALAHVDSTHADGVRLIVNPLADQIDLCLLIGQSLQSIRTVRCPAAVDQSIEQVLVREIQRTEVSLRNEMRECQLTEIVLMGADAASQRLGAAITESGRQVRLVDPWSTVSVATWRTNPPDNRSYFTPLLGALRQAGSGLPEDIDLMSPKRRPAPPDRRRLSIRIGALVGAIAAAIIGLLWWNIYQQDTAIAKLRAASKALDADVRKAEESKKQLAVLERWTKGDVHWLQQLAQIAQQSPAAEQMILDQLICASQESRRDVQLDGYVANPAVLDPWEATITDMGNTPVSVERQRKALSDKYPWRFKERIVIGAGKGVVKPTINTKDSPAKGTL